VDLSGWVGVGLGGNCDCRCGILMLLSWGGGGVVLAVLVWEISTSPHSLGILYKTLLARKLSKPEDGRYRPKHVVFPLLINTII